MDLLGIIDEVLAERLRDLDLRMVASQLITMIMGGERRREYFRILYYILYKAGITNIKIKLTSHERSILNQLIQEVKKRKQSGNGKGWNIASKFKYTIMDTLKTLNNTLKSLSLHTLQVL